MKSSLSTKSYEKRDSTPRTTNRKSGATRNSNSQVNKFEEEKKPELKDSDKSLSLIDIGEVEENNNDPFSKIPKLDLNMVI